MLNAMPVECMVEPLGERPEDRFVVHVVLLGGRLETADEGALPFERQATRPDRCGFQGWASVAEEDGAGVHDVGVVDGDVGNGDDRVREE
jgi:hypothetical protein